MFREKKSLSSFLLKHSPWVYNGVKAIHIQQKPHLEFWPFPGTVTWGATLFLWRWAAGAVPSQPHGLCGHSPCFSLSEPHSRNYMRYSTFYCKTGFVLDGFAQMSANPSAVSTFKAGQAQPRCSVVSFIKYISDWRLLQLLTGLSGRKTIVSQGGSVTPTSFLWQSR